MKILKVSLSQDRKTLTIEFTEAFNAEDGATLLRKIRLELKLRGSIDQAKLIINQWSENSNNMNKSNKSKLRQFFQELDKSCTNFQEEYDKADDEILKNLPRKSIKELDKKFDEEHLSRLLYASVQPSAFSMPLASKQPAKQ